MNKFFTTVACSAWLLASPLPAHAQISFGIHIGQPPADRAYRVPRQPGPDYDWIAGYWYPKGSRYTWHNGYWTRPPYEGAYWVAPYYDGGEYFAGQWQSGRGNVAHDHRSDKRRERDEDRRPNGNDRKGRPERMGDPGRRDDGRR